jgi:quercetin dioxygenase-like cupin family protein
LDLRKSNTVKDFHQIKDRMYFTPKLKLPVHGQGVFFFSAASAKEASFSVVGGNNKLHVLFTPEKVQITSFPSVEPLVDEHNNSGLLTSSAAYYWLSIDSQNQNLCAGVGEARLETINYKYLFEYNVGNKAFLESLTHIVIHKNSVKPIKFLRDPITGGVPLLLVDTPELTMADIAEGRLMPVANLPVTSKKLYECISGPKFTLNTPDFPEFYDAIEYSLKTPGLWCHETIKKKATEFNKDKPDEAETYLRITLGKNNGESPGIPYVMEIWPAGHFSPVHSHAGAEAVIRVLEGDINVSLFPFLSADVKPFASGNFVKDDVMWISPTLNQVHQLKNTGNETCVTIQCYMYDGTDKKHYDYFDYLDADGVVQQYTPDSDMDFLEFKDLMLEEWATKPGCW